MFFPPTASALPRSDRSAFTLLELLAVLAVLAILTSLVIGAGRRVVEHGKSARARVELAVLSAALQSYRRQHGDYPRTTDGALLVQALLGRLDPSGAPLAATGRAQIEAARFSFARATSPGAAADPFSDPAAVPVDPWGNPYRYAYKSVAPWTNPSFVLYSAGPDGADAPALRAGGFVDEAAPANADNLYAHRN
ncbi:type II secretion system protein GspG [Oleiharenicola sp. Vm1]|uniref:type II secretion system protein GspG n=1 Tax=Oleiharenicola sp. Vm1 TaxID=3398393 RepID=UPI0039F55D78